MVGDPECVLKLGESDHGIRVGTDELGVLSLHAK